MDRILAAMFLPALAFFLSAQAAPVPTHLMPKVSPFYPTEVGTKWEYEQDGMNSTEEIIRAEVRDGKTVLTIRVQSRGTWERTFEVSKDGVYWRTDGRFKVDECLLRFPVKAGDSWAVEVPRQKGLLAHTGRMTVGKGEEVTVPAGTFRATRVVFEVTAKNGRVLAKPETYTYWYAPEVGLVRFSFPTGDRTLTSFTTARR
jgi:hypothetical protein